MNVVMDSGAGCCVIDYGSLENIGMQKDIRKFDSCLLNASGHGMDILGVVNIYIQIPTINKPILQEFKVLHSKTYSKVLIGRDFMKHFGTIKFDFINKKVQLGHIWINGINIEGDEKVRLCKSTTIPPRTEQIVLVRCKEDLASVTADFEPKP